MQAFAHHKDHEYEDARAAAPALSSISTRATTMPPMRSTCWRCRYYDQIDDIGRDQGLTFQALQALREVIEKYPDTEYARSAILKFDLAFDHLGGKEMEIGRYYLKRKHYTVGDQPVPGGGRAVPDHHRTRPRRCTGWSRAYLSLGLTDEAQTAGAILGHNFQATEWYDDSYKLLTARGLKPEAKGDNWLAALYRQLIKGEWL